MLEVGAILIGLLHIFFYTDYHILHKLFELRPFMQTVLPYENHVECFSWLTLSPSNQQF